MTSHITCYTDRAVRNLDNMQKRCWDIENKYGATSDEALKATWSLLHAYKTMVRFPGKVYAEDDLSLIIQSWIQIGIIWHPVRHKTDNGWEPDPLLGEWSSHS